MKNKYCKWCNFLHIDHCVFEGHPDFSCVLEPNRKQFRDAAEFEARVAAKLTVIAVRYPYRDAKDDWGRRYDTSDRWRFLALREARIEVEEEMG